MRQAEITYYKRIFDNRKNNIKKLWELMGQLLTPTKQVRSSKSISKLLVSGKEISDDKQITNALNDYFANIRSTQLAVLQNSCSTVGILLGKLIQFLCLAGKMKYICWETFVKHFCEMGIKRRNFF